MGCTQCSAEKTVNRIVYACAGCADVGEVADQVGRKLRRDGYATPKASCLVGIGAGLKQFIDAAKAADVVMTIDGCEVGCAKKVIENIGISPQAVTLTQMGLEKGKTVSSADLVNSLCAAIVNP
jgi:uncharacterized metal-binding protein